jgi:hypothetical protein
MKEAINSSHSCTSPGLCVKIQSMSISDPPKKFVSLIAAIWGGKPLCNLVLWQVNTSGNVPVINIEAVSNFLEFRESSISGQFRPICPNTESSVRFPISFHTNRLVCRSCGHKRCFRQPRTSPWDQVISQTAAFAKIGPVCVLQHIVSPVAPRMDIRANEVLKERQKGGN